MVFDTLSNSEACLIRPSEAESHPYLIANWRQPWWRWSYSFRL